jgi:hypothetical protein
MLLDKHGKAITSDDETSHLSFFEGKKTSRNKALLLRDPTEEEQAFNSNGSIIGVRKELEDEMKTRLETAQTVADIRQEAKRPKMMSDAVMQALVTRVKDPQGYKVVKVSPRDWEKMHEDYRLAHSAGMAHKVDFEPLSAYMQKLLFMADGMTLREKPIRPLLQNEVGMYVRGDKEGTVIVHYDALPGDHGDGKYYQVHPNTPVADPIDAIMENASKC